MDENNHLILSHGKNVTRDVTFCKYNGDTKRYDVTFASGKTCQYAYSSIEWICKPDVLIPENIRVSRNGREFSNIREIRVFRADAAEYWRVCFANGKCRTYPRKELNVTKNCLLERESGDCLRYLQQIAAINDLKDSKGEVILQKQYEKLAFVGEDTAMAVYLNPARHRTAPCVGKSLIFPFGGNASQFKAVENALHNQISVIQGPPGTGKTQTILNIIANLLLDGKSIQVASFNNSATENVLEKLSSPKYNMGFLVAKLGNSENQRNFTQSQTGSYPDIADWARDKHAQKTLREKIDDHVAALTQSFSKRERLAQARLEMSALLLEFKYFEQYCNGSGLLRTPAPSRRSLKSKNVMKLWQECNAFSERGRSISLWFKIKSAFFYGIADWGFYSNELLSIVTFLQNLYYQTRKAELACEIADLETFLQEQAADEKMAALTECSMAYLRAKLFERYGNKAERERFDEDDFWKKPERVMQEYPIVLSTTFSSRSGLKGITYDYLIMDEASQVDIATGALALSCARNAVVVGDLKQLPNVINDETKKRSDAIFKSFDLAAGYSFSENSFLKSVCGIVANVPQTLLREHYRCHPKIIGFCNQKFYNNELLIMTEDRGEEDALMVFKTAAGDHRRERTNQRQIEVTLREVLPRLNEGNLADIGIIAPYRDQVGAISAKTADSGIDVNTVHKFQGREKDTIVMTTVDDVVTSFSDDPYLLNVAVSRAVKRFCLVASGNRQPSNSNIGDLIAYIEHHNFQIVESEIYSVFDMLYEQYTKTRLDFLKKHRRVSAYDSENIMYAALVDLLNGRPHLSLGIICHHSLIMLIRDAGRLDAEERRYATNTATHVDFLIYSKVTKKPVLAIEVDGFHYHKPGTKQHERDKMKDRILHLYGIPALRFATNGSDEMTQVGHALDAYERSRAG